MPADLADDLFFVFVEGSAARETPMLLALLVTGAFFPGRSCARPGHYGLVCGPWGRKLDDADKTA